MPLRETAISRATVAIRRCIEQGIPTFRPRLFRDQLLGRCPAAMGSITVLSTAHIPAKSFRIRASTMALARPNPRRGRWPSANKCFRLPVKAGPPKCCTTWIDGGGGPTWRICRRPAFRWQGLLPANQEPVTDNAYGPSVIKRDQCGARVSRITVIRRTRKGITVPIANEPKFTNDASAFLSGNAETVPATVTITDRG